LGLVLAFVAYWTAVSGMCFHHSAVSCAIFILVWLGAVILLAPRYVRCVMRYGNEWGVIQQAVDLCPHSPMAWLLQTDLYIAAEDAASARQSLARARAVLGASSVDSELAPPLDNYWKAWSHWLDGDLIHSAQCFENVLLQTPHDAFALKRAQLLYFLGGSPDRMQTVSDQPLRLSHE
jgi:hypothetical protein